MFSEQYAVSTNWEGIGDKERSMLWAQYESDIRKRGLPIIVRGEIVFSREVEIKEGEKCPLCWEHKEESTQGFVKIIDPAFETGFLDKGGVWAYCPHRKRGFILISGTKILAKLPPARKRKAKYKEYED